LAAARVRVKDAIVDQVAQAAFRWLQVGQLRHG
jgi:hypothetical protein